MPMLSGLMFSQPFDKAIGRAQFLSPPLGTNAWDAATRSPVISRAGRMTVGPPGAVWEANNSMVWQEKPLITLAEPRANSDSCKCLSQRPRLSRSRREREKARPARHHRLEQQRWAWHEASPRLRLQPETPCGGGSRNAASTRQRGRWRKENSQPWVSKQYICFSAHVLQRQPRRSQQESRNPPPIRR